MNWRRAEFAMHGDLVVWLSDAEAVMVYAEAYACLSRSHYGLDSATIGGIERLDVDSDPPEAADWLSKRCGPMDRELRLVFDRSEVCAVTAGFFIANWRDLMMPSRDDVVILPTQATWVLYYCHEDVFEFGQRGRGSNR